MGNTASLRVAVASSLQGPVRAPTGRWTAVVGVMILCGAAAAAGAGVGVLTQVPGMDPGREAQIAAAVVNRALAHQLQGKLAESRQTLSSHREELAESKVKLEALESTGLLQDARDLQAAERLGLRQALTKDLEKLPSDDAPRVLAALVREGRRTGLDPILLAAVIRVETHFDPYAVSNVGARGLMQLMPATASGLAEKSGHHRVAPAHLFNPVLNIELGAAYLKQLIDRFGDVRTALIAYNAGPGVARNRHLSSGVRAYPRNVLSEYSRLRFIAQKAETEQRSAVASAR